MALTRIYGNLITSGTITGNLFLNNTITGDKIAIGTLGANVIIASSITGDKIAAATIGSSNLTPTLAIGNSSGAIANTTLDVYGGAAMNVVTLATTSNTVNVALANYFISTPAGTSTWIFTGAPVSRDSSFVLQLANGGSYTVTWPSSVRWPANTAPTLSTNGVDLLIFSTVNTGTTWRGSSLTGYTA